MPEIRYIDKYFAGGGKSVKGLGVIITFLEGEEKQWTLLQKEELNHIIGEFITKQNAN